MVRAHVAVKSLRLTDNGDNDGFADPNETVQVYVTLRNGSGAARDGIVIRLLSTDPAVACIPTPVVSFGTLAAGEAREGTTPLMFRVADVARLDPFQDLAVTVDFAISGDDFDSTRHPQQATLDLDLNVSGGLLPSTFTEGFEDTSFGASAPAPGQGWYYLVRRAGAASLCTFHSWTSGSLSEVPAAGGNRDEDIALDPDTCP